MHLCCRQIELTISSLDFWDLGLYQFNSSSSCRSSNIAIAVSALCTLLSADGLLGAMISVSVAFSQTPVYTAGPQMWGWCIRWCVSASQLLGQYHKALVLEACRCKFRVTTLIWGRYMLPKTIYVACMVHHRHPPNWIYEGNVFRPFHTLRELSTYIPTKHCWNILIGGRDMPRKRNGSLGGGILIPIPILISVFFRGPSCVWSYTISRKLHDMRLSFNLHCQRHNDTVLSWGRGHGPCMYQRVGLWPLRCAIFAHSHVILTQVLRVGA